VGAPPVGPFPGHKVPETRTPAAPGGDGSLVAVRRSVNSFIHADRDNAEGVIHQAWVGTTAAGPLPEPGELLCRIFRLSRGKPVYPSTQA
jgi:hypothetical protein